MDSQLIGLISIAASVSLAIFFGLRGVPRDLSVIKEKLISIEVTIGKVWDVVISRPDRLQTVVRNFTNLGKVTISADPHETETLYRIRVEKPIISSGMIIRLSRETGLDKTEISMFKKETQCTALSKNELIMHVPCLESKLCTEYITIFLKWLDTTYLERFQSSLAEFEEPITT